MLDWIVIAALVSAGFSVASMLAVWAFGRFARRAQGAVSQALPRAAAGGDIDRRVVTLLEDHPGQSGLALLSANVDAFAARVMTARLAARSLDLMYYIWEDDLTGRFLLAEVLAAADRGVRVRLLLDDVGVSSRDALFAALNAHPGIAIRLFNPTRSRRAGLRRGIEMALRFFSMTRRMHNKAWIVDGRIAIMGGRNIGDAYFDAGEQSNFQDLDLFALGPVVDQAEAMFDLYWNSGFALPLRALTGEIRDQRKLRARRQALAGLSTSPAAAPYIAHIREQSSRLLPERAALHWCEEARLLADPPQKALGQKGENWMMRQLLPIIEAAEQRVDITSPYFVPGEIGTARFVALVARGIDLRVLTNSLAATDVAAVHGGYARYRPALLRGGISLYELRPVLRAKRLSFRGKSRASLHTKAFCIDNRQGFIGSLNFDPRSASLNTEMGVIFHAPGLITAMTAIFDEETSGDFSYELALDGQGRMIWLDREAGGAGRVSHEPEARLPRRLIARVVGWLPLESQL